MYLKKWALALANLNGNKLSNIITIPREQLRYITSQILDFDGNVKNMPQRLVLVVPYQQGINQYFLVQQIVHDCLLTTERKLYKLSGLKKYIDDYCGFNPRYVLDQNNPYIYQYLEGLSVTGKNHRVNEDSYTIVVHPKSEQLKLLVVADGMGGIEAGEKASRLLTSTLANIYCHLEPKYLEDSDWVERNLELILQRCNQVVHDELVVKQHLNTGTTLACAFINSRDTVVANVGDSRICIVQNGVLKIVSIDDSPNWNINQRITVDALELMRTMPNNNVITQYVGSSHIRPHIARLSNKVYSDLYLFSDGVTDCISYHEMNKIAQEVDKNVLFSFIEASSFGADVMGAKIKASDDRTVVHYGRR